MSTRFGVGAVVHRREVLHGRVWLSMPVRVVADDEVLAVWLTERTPLTFPPHPYGAHPWAAYQRWTGTSVLQLHRPDDAYSVWGFFHGRRMHHWYINFQAPFRRTADGFDTLDHGLDIVIRGDRWGWKDRDDVAEHVRTGRLTSAEADAVWAAADRVATALDRGERWWLPAWARWQPPQGA